jgi:hypothetical protein
MEKPHRFDTACSSIVAGAGFAVYYGSHQTNQEREDARLIDQ